MKKISVLVLLSFLCLILDNVLMPFFGVYGYYPNITLCFIICYSIVNGSWEGLWLGVACGIVQDIYFVNIFGINAFSNMLICTLAGIIGANIFKEKRLIPVIATFILTILKGVIVVSILYFFKVTADNMAIFYIALYNMVISIFMYKFVLKLCKKEYMQIRWKF